LAIVNLVTKVKASFCCLAKTACPQITKVKNRPASCRSSLAKTNFTGRKPWSSLWYRRKNDQGRFKSNV